MLSLFALAALGLGWLSKPEDLLAIREVDREFAPQPCEPQGYALWKRAVERSLAWLGRSRRLSKDYEHTAVASESWCYLASISLLLKRLRPSATQEPPYVRKAA